MWNISCCFKKFASLLISNKRNIDLEREQKRISQEVGKSKLTRQKTSVPFVAHLKYIISLFAYAIFKQRYQKHALCFVEGIDA
jgi:uncharacterized protein (DUF2225 family)